MRVGESLQNKEVVVAADDDLDAAGSHQASHHFVGRVTAQPGLDGLRLKNFGGLPQEPLILLDDGDREPQFLFQFAANFEEDSFAGDDVVAFQSEFKHRLAQSPCRRRRDHHIRIKHDPHERALNTSSSVKSP